MRLTIARRALIVALSLCAMGSAAFAISGKSVPKQKPHWYCKAHVPTWDETGKKTDESSFTLVMISGSQYDKSASPSCQAL